MQAQKLQEIRLALTEKDDIKGLEEALQRAREEKTRLQDELSQLRESLKEERRRLKRIIITGLGRDVEVVRQARSNLKRSGA